jgi:hypothetical protein
MIRRPGSPLPSCPSNTERSAPPTLPLSCTEEVPQWVRFDTHHPRHQVPRGQRAARAADPHAVGADPSAPLLLIDVGTDQGIVGRSYIFTYTIATLAPVARLAAEIIPELVGQPVVPGTSSAISTAGFVAWPPGAARHAAVRPRTWPCGCSRSRRRLARSSAARRPAAAAAGL